MKNIAKSCCKAFQSAPHHHRYLTLVVMVTSWYVLEQVLHYEIAAKGIEVFGVVPFAERVFGAFFGEAD
jgi:hypothetical protein